MKLRTLLTATTALAFLAAGFDATAQTRAGRLRMGVAGEAPTPPTPTVLIPGTVPPNPNGQTLWTLSTAPPAGGSPTDFAYNQTPIAQWTTVQNIYFDGPGARIAAVAWHVPTAAEFAAGLDSNLEYAEAQCDGDDGQAVRKVAMTFNSQTGYDEFYWDIEDDETVWPDGRHECRLFLKPLTGQGRVLQGSVTSQPLVQLSLYFTTNFGGSLLSVRRYVNHVGGSNSPSCGQVDYTTTPCLTITYAKERIATASPGNVGVGTICLAESPTPYILGGNTESFARSAPDRYLTVSSCGQNPANVIVAPNPASSGGLRVKRLRLHQITYRGNSLYSSGTGGGIEDPVCWFDDVTMDAGSRFAFESQPTSGTWRGCFATDSEFVRMMKGPQGMILNRGNTVHEIGEDAFSYAFNFINSTVYDLDRRYWMAATYTSGSPVLTSVAHLLPQPRVGVGASINICGLGDAEVIAVDAGAATMTLEAPCATSGSTPDAVSGLHSDLFQLRIDTVGFVFKDYIFYNSNVAGGGQGLFLEAGTVNNRFMTNFASVNMVWDTSTPPIEYFVSANINHYMTHGLFIDSTFTATRSWDGSTVDSAWIRGNCNAVVTKPGLVKYNAPSC